MKQDIIKTEVKKVNGTKWQFQFRENGYVILSMYSEVKKGKEYVVNWKSQLHAVDINACMQYIHADSNGKCEFLNYEDLESA